MNNITVRTSAPAKQRDFVSHLVRKLTSVKQNPFHQNNMQPSYVWAYILSQLFISNLKQHMYVFRY